MILFIGDGMGVSTVTAARIFDGQSRGRTGEENVLSFERFPNVALVKTYNTNQQVPDSAGSATAIYTGVKTRAGVIGIGPGPRRGDCAAASSGTLESIGEMAKRRGKSLGIVTTTRVTHATPAALYAHTPERDWESDRFLPGDPACTDIARQLIEFDAGGGWDIVLGGGAREFYGAAGNGQRRNDNDDLVAGWLAAGDDRRYVNTREELAQSRGSGRVLGLFAPSHMTYVAERGADSDEPTLTEMTRAAIAHLEHNAAGYFLMVEGGRIDHGHHDGKPGYALLETQEFANAVSAALDMVDLDETLVLVTADHSHVFTIAGYPTRGNPILGLVEGNDLSGEPTGRPRLASDGRPYATLGYTNGPGAIGTVPRPVPDTGIDAVAQSTYRVQSTNLDGTIDDSETHGGEDVAAYAAGRGAHCLSGVIEQDRLFDVMVAAFGWRDACTDAQ